MLSVGNCTNQTSTLPGIVSGGSGYDADMAQHGGVTIVYDSDGNRAQKIVAGVTTNFATASVNPTGYAPRS